MTPERPLPVTIVSGYLGSGKTTLVNHLLAGNHGKRLAVLVNDFGEIAIDEELIANRDGETIALANGCMCCSIGGDLYDAIDRIIRSRVQNDHLIIETSGVADPGKVLQIALAEPELDAFGIVTLVDMANLRQLMADRFLDDTIRRQIAAAGLLLLTKSDLCDQAVIEETSAVVDDLAPGALRLLAENGEIPFELILARMSDSKSETDSLAASPLSHGHHAQDHEHSAAYRSWAYSGSAVVSRDVLERFIRSDDLGMYRLKGFVRLDSGETVEVHRVGNTSRITEHAGDAAETRLVAIGPAKRFSPERVQTRWLEAVDRARSVYPA